jgi:sugar lactone lactonase YvrE
MALAGLLASGAPGPPTAGEPGLLVAMHDTGRVERYDPKTGAHQATLVSGLTAPNVVAEGPDGRLYVSTGAPGGPGAVLRFDARTGRRLDTFVAVPPGKPGHLARATGLAWHDGDLLVASQGDGKVHRYDGKTGGWKAHVATASPGGVTQIAVRDGRLYLTDFVAKALRVSDMTAADKPAPVWADSASTPRGGWRSTPRGGLLRHQPEPAPPGRRAAVKEWAGGGKEGLKTPVGVAAGPDGRLYAANLHGNTVGVWGGDAASDSPARVIGGEAMRGPIGVAFTRQPFVPPARSGTSSPGRQHRDGLDADRDDDLSPAGRQVLGRRCRRSASTPRAATGPRRTCSGSRSGWRSPWPAGRGSSRGTCRRRPT